MLETDAKVISSVVLSHSHNMATPTTVEAVLSQALEKLKIGEYTLDINYNQNAGDGYCSDTCKVKVKHQRGENNFFIKQATTNETQRNFLSVEETYKNEVSFYTTVFSAFDDFQKEKSVKTPFQIAKCYAASLKDTVETLVLEDLAAAGYQLYGREKPVEEFHMSLVLSTYGRFHALSLALRHQQPEVFKTITGSLKNLFPVVFPKVAAGFKLSANKNVQMLLERGYTAESKLAESIANNLEETLTMPCAPEDEPYSVVTHGDCWSNNMMFKYDVSALLQNHTKSFNTKTFF